MKTFYILYPGLHKPANFEPQVAPVLLAQQDLWQASRGAQPSLIFRVRTDSDHGERFGEYDRLESCVGLVDSVTRWRGVFRHAGYALSAIRTPALADVCSKALQVVASQHPSAVSMMARRQMADNIAQVAEGAASFEQVVALSIAAVVMADSDYEAAMVVPFGHAFMPYSEKDEPEEFRARLATIETMAGAMLLTEAASRLAERIPEWLGAKMPEPLSAERPVVGPRSDVDTAAAVDRPNRETDNRDDGGVEDDKPDGL